MLIVFATVACLPNASVALASDSVEWTQYHGPNRDNVAPETTTWPATGPKKLWASAVGWGYSSFAVATGRVYTMGSSNKLNSATTYCLDADTGNILWEHTIALSKREVVGCTPSIAGDRVISAGPGGELVCLDAMSGRVIWEALMGLKPFLYCYGASPLVYNNKVIVIAGSTIRAFALADGSELWKTDWVTPPGGGCWSSPVLGTFDGQKTVVCLSRSNMVGVCPDDGKMLWKLDFESKPTGEDLVNTPTVISNRIICLAYRIAGARSTRLTCIEIKNGKPAQIWKSETRSGQRAQSPVVRDNCVYVTSDVAPVKTPRDAKGQICCYDVQTGKLLWSSNEPQSRGPLPPVGKQIWNDGGSFMMAGSRLVILDGTGHLEMAEVSAKKCTVLGDAPFDVPDAVDNSEKGSAPSSDIFHYLTPPLLLNGRLYVRNHGKVVCYDMQ